MESNIPELMSSDVGLESWLFKVSRLESAEVKSEFDPRPWTTEVSESERATGAARADVAV